MKDFEVELRIKNNQIKERREKLGFSQGQLAEAAGISIYQLRKFEAIRTRSTDQWGKWKESALKLAEFLCVEPDILFPEAAKSVVQPVIRKKLDAMEIPALAGSGVGEATAALVENNPQERLERHAIRDKVQKALSALTPRHALALRLRFGFDGKPPHKLDDVASVLNVTRETARQTILIALSRVQDWNRLDKPYPRDVEQWLDQQPQDL